MEEASANFDLEDVQPVLGRIASLIEAGFTAADASVLAAKIAAQSVDSEQEYEYEVRFGGRDVPLRVVVFMDDVEAPDIAFFAPRDLAQQIDATIGKYMEEVGK